VNRGARSCEQVRPDLALYARGLLGASEHDLIETHLSECTSCAEDAAFSFELEQALRLGASDRDHTAPALGGDFTRRVMTAIGVGSPAPVLRLRPARRAWTVLAAAAGLLAILSLAYRERPALFRKPAGGSQVPVAAASIESDGGPMLLAQFKAALDICGQPPSAAAARAGWGGGHDLFGDLNEAGGRALPRQDPFFLNDPYASLFSDILPRYPVRS
jgi:Putative zinc-finger